MYTSGTPGGRERRKHTRFQLRRDVRIDRGDTSYEGTLLDISVGGAAIECRALPDVDTEFAVDIDGLGIYPAYLVRRIDANVVAVQFSINEALAVRLAARVAVAFQEQQGTSSGGADLQEIEILPEEHDSSP